MLWCLWWDVLDNCIDSWSLPSFLFNYTENFTTKKWKKISDKKTDIFHISAQNIDCGYSFEAPRRGGSNEYHNLCFWAEIRKIMFTPVNNSFTIQKWGLRGSALYRYVFVIAKFPYANNEDSVLCGCANWSETSLCAHVEGMLLILRFICIQVIICFICPTVL